MDGMGVTKVEKCVLPIPKRIDKNTWERGVPKAVKITLLDENWTVGSPRGRGVPNMIKNALLSAICAVGSSCKRGVTELQKYAIWKGEVVWEGGVNQPKSAEKNPTQKGLFDT